VALAQLREEKWLADAELLKVSVSVHNLLS
jgi:hypothetical protein